MFYAYTKRDFDFSELHKLKNFVLHKSFVELDGKKVINYGSSDKIAEIAEKSGGFICPLAKDRTGLCGSEQKDGCTFCMQKCNEGTPILFVEH